MDIRAGKQMRERGPRGKANGGKGVLAGKQMLGSLGFDIFSSPAYNRDRIDYIEITSSPTSPLHLKTKEARR